jgi:hypothetical protein
MKKTDILILVGNHKISSDIVAYTINKMGYKINLCPMGCAVNGYVNGKWVGDKVINFVIVNSDDNDKAFYNKNVNAKDIDIIRKITL